MLGFTILTSARHVRVHTQHSYKHRELLDCRIHATLRSAHHRDCCERFLNTLHVVQMTTTPRVELKFKASGTCYLSDKPPFYFHLDGELSDSVERQIFLEDGFAGSQDYQPINSNQVIQCFDYETGEQVQVLHQGTQAVFCNNGCSKFTTSSRREPYELPFITSSLRPDRKYILRFKPTTSISHWPASLEDTLTSLERVNCSSFSTLDVPALSAQAILWEAADGNDTIMFKTRSVQPRPPNVTVSISAPSTCSLSKPFKFKLLFSTDAEDSITVLANRSLVTSVCSDISIRNSTSQDAPVFDICLDESEVHRDEFLSFKKTLTEHRELNISDASWRELKPEIGKEYILKHLPGSWWWTDESIDEVMEYLESKSSLGLAFTDCITFASAGEVRFKVVE